MTGAKDDSQSGHRGRLRGRLMESGVHSLQDYEVIELALTFAIKRADTKALAKELIKEFKSVSAVLDATPEELKKVKGVGDAVAQAFQMIRGIGEYYRRDRALQSDYFAGPSEVIRYVQQKLRALREECFIALYLDARNAFLDDETISRGTLVRTTVYPATIFRTGLLKNAAAVVLAHNHPGGKATPSRQDLALTLRMMHLGAGLDIPVVDHVIVAGADYYSMAERGDIARLRGRMKEIVV